MPKRKSLFPQHALEELARIKNSYVVLKQSTTTLSVQPRYLKNIKEGIQICIRKKLKEYDKKLNGIILGYKNVKVNMGSARFSDKYSGDTLYEADWECFVFQPIVGCRLEGVVTTTTHDHIACVVLQYFNAKIFRPQAENDDNWSKRQIHLGATLEFRVKELDFSCGVPIIEGELLDTDLVDSRDINKIEGPQEGSGKKRKRKLDFEAKMLSSTQRPCVSKEGGLDIDLSPIPLVKPPSKNEISSPIGVNSMHNTFLSPQVPTKKHRDPTLSDDRQGVRIHNKKRKLESDFVSSPDSHLEDSRNIIEDASDSSINLKKKKKKKKSRECAESIFNVSTCTDSRENKFVAQDLDCLPSSLASEKVYKKLKIDSDSTHGNINTVDVKEANYLLATPGELIVSTTNDEDAASSSKKKPKKSKVKEKPHDYTRTNADSTPKIVVGEKDPSLLLETSSKDQLGKLIAEKNVSSSIKKSNKSKAQDRRLTVEGKEQEVEVDISAGKIQWLSPEKHKKHKTEDSNELSHGNSAKTPENALLLSETSGTSLKKHNKSKKKELIIEKEGCIRENTAIETPENTSLISSVESSFVEDRSQASVVNDTVNKKHKKVKKKDRDPKPNASNHDKITLIVGDTPYSPADSRLTLKSNKTKKRDRENEVVDIVTRTVPAEEVESWSSSTKKRKKSKKDDIKNKVDDIRLTATPLKSTETYGVTAGLKVLSAGSAQCLTDTPGKSDRKQNKAFSWTTFLATAEKSIEKTQDMSHKDENTSSTRKSSQVQPKRVAAHAPDDQLVEADDKSSSIESSKKDDVWGTISRVASCDYDDQGSLDSIELTPNLRNEEAAHITESAMATEVRASMTTCAPLSSSKIKNRKTETKRVSSKSPVKKTPIKSKSSPRKKKEVSEKKPKAARAKTPSRIIKASSTINNETKIGVSSSKETTTSSSPNRVKDAIRKTFSFHQTPAKTKVEKQTRLTEFFESSSNSEHSIIANNSNNIQDPNEALRKKLLEDIKRTYNDEAMDDHPSSPAQKSKKPPSRAKSLITKTPKKADGNISANASVEQSGGKEPKKSLASSAKPVGTKAEKETAATKSDHISRRKLK